MPKMTHESYKTIKEPSRGLFKDRGSKFLSFAFPVVNENEIKKKLDDLRREYHDARHHCYAWVLGRDKENFRANDDGEPSSTAGKPILAQINKNDLTNVLVVVVRYFGGTLLGTGGLINAYREAAAMALADAEIITRTIDEVFTLKFPYTSLNMVMKVLDLEEVVQTEQDFGAGCSIKIRVPRMKADKVIARLKIIDNVVVENIKGSY